jgi:hypothetical protein
MARIDPLADDDAQVLAQFPGELTASDIDRVDPRRALRQQDIGKPAGRSPDIECDKAGDGDGEMVERMGELGAAARYPGVVAPAYFEAGRVGDRFAGLGDAPITGKDDTGEDQRLGPLPAFRQPAFDEQLVGALFGWARAGASGSGSRRLAGDVAAERGERGGGDMPGGEAGGVVLRVRRVVVEEQIG